MPLSEMQQVYGLQRVFEAELLQGDGGLASVGRESAAEGDQGGLLLWGYGIAMWAGLDAKSEGRV
jgi:hypothetical protein